MTNINGVVFVIVGFAVTMISHRIGSSFRFFFWVGIILFIYGVVKIVMQYLQSQTQGKKKPVQHTSHTGQHHRTKYYTCPRCHQRIFPSFHYCAKCGYKLR